MQAYPGRNPVLDAIRGAIDRGGEFEHTISVRQLRVMLENLPPANAIDRELGSRWGDFERLLHDISSGVRDLTALTYNINRPKGQAALESKHLPTPEELEQQEAAERTPEQAVAELAHLRSVIQIAPPRALAAGEQRASTTAE
jgi:hypothetical protein